MASGEEIRIMTGTAEQAARTADDITALVRMTGPESYDYIFGTDGLLDAYVRRAWAETGNLYGHDAATLALDGDALVGIEIGYPGTEYYLRHKGMASIGADMARSGEVPFEKLLAVGQRAEKASYLNSHVPDDVYYLMTLAVPPEQRGRGIGKRLLLNAIDRARENGFRALHLDVLSNNPAVGLYLSAGLTCAAEIVAPDLNRDHGIPMEMRMTINLQEAS